MAAAMWAGRWFAAQNGMRAGLLVAACLVAVGRAGAEEPPPQSAEAAAVETAAAATHVRIKLEVAGELFMPVGGDAAPLREPVEMTATFDFDEVPAAALGQGVAEASGAGQAAVRRTYRDAAATMRIGAAETTAALGADARELLVARYGTTPVPYLADGFLSGEESDLLETPFDSLLLDELLPRGRAATVAIGDTWPIAGDLAAGLLGVDTVESGGLEARIDQVADGLAQAVLSGIVDGAVDGVPTHVTVEGSFAVAARDAAGNDGLTDGQPMRRELHGPVKRVAVVIRERREASHVAPGFEVEARLLIERVPAESQPAAADVVAEAGQAPPLQRRRGMGGPGRIWYRDPQGRFDLVHDLRWRRVENGANGLVLRLVDRGALVGQCSITSLPQAPSPTLPGRADLQRDIERSLAGQIERINAAEETDRADGLRVVRVESSGTAGRLPFRWIHYLLAAQDGSQASVAFMFEESMRERFGDADRPLIDAVRLPAGRTAAAPGSVRQ